MTISLGTIIAICTTIVAVTVVNAYVKLKNKQTE